MSFKNPAVVDNRPFLARAAVHLTECFLVLGLFLTALTGCSQLPLASQFLNQPTQTEATTAFFDDFSNTKSGWDRIQTPLGMSDYKKDTYRILVNEPNTDLFANPKLTLKDVIIEVTATRIEGPDQNNFGVICRYLDEKNFYAAQISSSGYGGIFRMKDGNYQLLGLKEMLPVPSILGGNTSNHIRFECIGSTLLLIVNGAPVDIREDDSFEIGDVGLIAGTYDQTGVHVAFDDFSVTQP